MRGAGDGSKGRQRGFTLLETIVATAIVMLALLAVAALHGAQPPVRREAALELQSALAETRALAGANANTTAAAPSGATLTAQPVANGGTRLAVFASRPIAGAPPLVADRGFPPVVVPVSITIPGVTVAGQSFAILVSSAGDAGIAGNFLYDPAAPSALPTDPGCDEANGETISVADGVSSETHVFDCRSAQYEADVAPPPARAYP